MRGEANAAQLALLRSQLEQARSEIAGLRGSTSWKLTAPLRWVTGWLRPPHETVEPEPPRPPAQPQTADSLALTPEEIAHQRRALGLDAPPPRLPVAVGIVLEQPGMAPCIVSAIHGLGGDGQVFLAGVAPAAGVPAGATFLAAGEGWAAAQNRMMAAAFAGGAGLYVAADAEGAFHPGAIAALARMSEAQGGRAVLGARPFPDWSALEFDPRSLDAGRLDACCIAIPHAVFAALGGFSEGLGSLEAVDDLCRRARAEGLAVRAAPLALFLREGVDDDRPLAGEAAPR